MLSCFYFKLKANCQINVIHTIILNESWTGDCEQINRRGEWVERRGKGKEPMGRTTTEKRKWEEPKKLRVNNCSSSPVFEVKQGTKVCLWGERGGGERERMAENERRESQDGNMRGPVSSQRGSLMHPEPLYKYHKEWMMSRGRAERRGR